jgi:hypothetical protein
MSGAGTRKIIVEKTEAVMAHEPRKLMQGKRFHGLVQKEWTRTAQGRVSVETGCRKRSGRRGRMDVFVNADSALVAIVEIKSSRWDRIAVTAVRRNILRHARQLWEYLEPQLDAGRDVCPGIIFPRRPTSSRRLKLIEDLFAEHGIAAAWQDESLSRRRARTGLIPQTLK